MYLVKIGNNIEYKNSIPVVKNDSPDPSAAGFTPSSTDSVIIDSIYGGNKEITREDALLYKYRQENPVSIFDTYQQYTPITDASQISENFIDQINQEDVKCWDIFRFQFAFDFNEYGDDLEENLRSLAAAYVTARDHLNTHFTGSKLEGYITWQVFLHIRWAGFWMRVDLVMSLKKQGNHTRFACSPFFIYLVL